MRASFRSSNNYTPTLFRCSAVLPEIEVGAENVLSCPATGVRIAIEFDVPVSSVAQPGATMTTSGATIAGDNRCSTMFSSLLRVWLSWRARLEHALEDWLNRCMRVHGAVWNSRHFLARQHRLSVSSYFGCKRKHYIPSLGPLPQLFSLPQLTCHHVRSLQVVSDAPM